MHAASPGGHMTSNEVDEDGFVLVTVQATGVRLKFPQMTWLDMYV